MQSQSVDATIQSQPTAPLPFRHDTILGVCQGIGEDFGISPTWLRLAFAAMLFVQPMWTIAAYFALGLLVATARLIASDSYSTPDRPDCGADPLEVAAETEKQPKLPLAA